jgi:hypothetical protein
MAAQLKQIEDRRVGRFRIANALLRDWPIAVLVKALEGVVVVETRASWADDSTEFIARGEMFAAVRHGEVVPEYELQIATGPDGDIAASTWRRLDVTRGE